MRILGIDLGSSSVKAVEIDSAFGRFDIHDYHENPVPLGSTPEEAAAKLIRSLTKAPDKIITSLKASHTTFRNLHLPTRDKKAIQSGVSFEMEDELPFSTETSLFDYAITLQSKQGSEVHIAASLKAYVVQAIQSWQNVDLDPDVITTEAWAYRILLNRILDPASQDLPVLLVQIGHEKTTFYLHWKGTPSLIREFSWGGKDLTTSICQFYQMPLDQAESVKLDRGFLIADQASEEITPEQRELTSCLEQAIEPLLLELKQVELMSKNVTRHSISSIFLAGGTSLLPGFGKWLELRLQIPVKSLRALSSSTTSGVTYSDQTEARFLLATSLAFCLVGSDRALCVNFRKGEFAKETRAREFNLEALKKPLIAAGCVAASLLLSLIIQSMVYKSQLKTADVQLEKSIRAFFGQISSSALRTYVANTNSLRTAVQKELSKQREINRLFGPNSRSPLDFLNYVSKIIPKDIVVDMDLFQAGIGPSESYVAGDQNQTSTLSFLVANPQVAEKLNSVLGTKLSSLQRGKMEEVAIPDSGEKKWKITFTAKPPEDAYVK
jgi:general secretion pathway protein L